MRLVKWMLALWALAATSVSAQTLVCDVPAIKINETAAFLSNSYSFDINRADFSAVVRDPVSQKFNGKAEIAELDEFSDSRVTLSWALEGARMSDARSNLNFRATWLRAKNIFVIRVMPFRSRFNGTAEGRGTCSLTE